MSAQPGTPTAAQLAVFNGTTQQGVDLRRLPLLTYRNVLNNAINRARAPERAATQLAQYVLSHIPVIMSYLVTMPFLFLTRTLCEVIRMGDMSLFTLLSCLS